MSGYGGLRSPSTEALRVQWTATHSEEQYGWLGLRVRWATSWLNRATRRQHSFFYWITFNALYAEDTDRFHDASDPDVAQRFFGKVCRLDRERVAYDTIWSRFSGPIRLLLDSPYVYKRYWINNKTGGGGDWQEGTHAPCSGTTEHLRHFVRGLYVLRNQLVHGGATWNSKAATRSRMVRRLWQPSCPISYRS